MEKEYDLIIIGGGPAGASAGVYLARQKVKTLLVAKDFLGQIGKKPVAVENYLGFNKILGSDLAKKFENHLKENEIEIKETVVNSIKKENDKFLISLGNKESFLCKSVIIATGSDPRPLEVKGEKEFIGKGVSYCAICDGAFFSENDVVVIGGGNSGFETALYMKDIAKKIYILEFSEEPKAEKILKNRVASFNNIEIITNVRLKEIKGDDSVQKIIYEDKISGEEKNLNVQGVFVQIGYQPATAFVKGLVEFNDKDEIVVNHLTGETNTPGIFAAGDVSDSKYKQLIIAAGEGAKVALSAYNYLQR